MSSTILQKLYKLQSINMCRMVGVKEFSATKTGIARILTGRYVKEIDEEKQSHVLLEDGSKMYRANVLATIVGIDEEDNSLIVDDGTGKIRIKSFDEKFFFNKFSLGEVVLIIGKIREFGEKYILPEIVKKITDKRWIDVRKKELNLVNHATIEIQNSKEENEEMIENNVEDSRENKTETILSVIRNLDEGEGADLDQVLIALSTTATEKDIEKLLGEGEIFQTRPGKIKVLD